MIVAGAVASHKSFECFLCHKSDGFACSSLKMRVFLDKTTIFRFCSIHSAHCRHLKWSFGLSSCERRQVHLRRLTPVLSLTKGMISNTDCLEDAQRIYYLQLTLFPRTVDYKEPLSTANSMLTVRLHIKLCVLISRLHNYNALFFRITLRAIT